MAIVCGCYERESSTIIRLQSTATAKIHTSIPQGLQGAYVPGGIARNSAPLGIT
jgi:hypothetical protein